MFSLSGTNQPPKLSTNLGKGTRHEFDYDIGAGPTLETVDMVELLAFQLELAGLIVERGDRWIEHKETGYFLLPQILAINPQANGRVLSASTVQVNHHRLIPEGVFEYQYATGESLNQAFADGFAKWVQSDFVPLLSALQTEPTCNNFVRPDIGRRVVFGPASRLLLVPPESVPVADSESEQHVFCDCCLFTNSMSTFNEITESDKFYCLRLFAARNEDGNLVADCRLNGEDYPKGETALIAYAGTWPGSGYEARKQYVVVHSLD